ncbi:RrF2 family transcriptional regulator [Woodsholea maritima]|uniref:RrF2 family transcriptional regulator n=1 Tax=Woodsholea maritima TaxID=240237 RepID=UPI000361ADED|nr:Rrf2 family transcriptional regulator [Woodsholea maritima]
MRLTRYTDYALRVLIYLAVHDETLHTIQELADIYGVSKNHLMKIVHNLSSANYIDSVRGRTGGIRLAKAPEEINLGILIRHTEDDLAIVECFSAPTNHCVLTPQCHLQSVVSEALSAFLAVFDRYTLADLVANRSCLKSLFSQLGLDETGHVYTSPNHT